MGFKTCLLPENRSRSKSHTDNKKKHIKNWATGLIVPILYLFLKCTSVNSSINVGAAAYVGTKCVEMGKEKVCTD